MEPRALTPGQAMAELSAYSQDVSFWGLDAHNRRPRHSLHAQHEPETDTG